MYFVMAYSRKQGKRLAFDTFEEKQRTEANDRYTSLLHDYLDTDDVEVNVFESESEEVFRITHARYFQSASDSIESLRRALQ
jgi:hypothetical protein